MDAEPPSRRDFASRLYEKLAATQSGNNLFLSPFSIQVALAMCAVGARGATRDVMADLIGAPDSVDEQNREYAALLTSVHGEGERPFQLATANALWGQQGFRYKPEYRMAVAEFYGGAFHEVDFRNRPEEAVQTINAWVSGQTLARITGFIDRGFLARDTRLILTNAIYFQGKWEKDFEKAGTRDEDWYGPSGTGKVLMMHQRGGHLHYEGDDFQALDLSYKGRQLSMLIVLPKARTGLNSLENHWAARDSYRQTVAGLDPETVVVSLPRFSVEAEFKLRPVLCSLHAELAFSEQADFSGIGDEPLQLSEVLHKALIEVNEEGTEAAAATAVRKSLSTGLGSPPPKPVVFEANHPFLFFIRDRKTNAVLFSGRVLDPKKPRSA